MRLYIYKSIWHLWK